MEQSSLYLKDSIDNAIRDEFQIAEIRADKIVPIIITDDNKKQFERDIIYLRMASIWGENSHCKRKKVGSLIVRDGMIISDGYNGTPSGFDNDCEDENNITKWYVLHAEANAITKLAKSSQTSSNSTLYITLSPCKECSKKIIQSGITRVFFCEFYNDLEGLELMLKANIELIWIKKENIYAHK